jgi:hypothetical protein
MALVGCHESGKGIICLDERNSSAACCKNSKTCGWAKYADITYMFRSVEISDGFSIDIPSNAVGINTHENSVSWLEPRKLNG